MVKRLELQYVEFSFGAYDMELKQIITQHKDKMKKATDIVVSDFKGLRTGRASTGLVENLHVEYYGNPTPLKQMASIVTPQADSVVIKPFDPSVIKDIEKAIKSSDLSIAPMVDGKTIRLNIPPLNSERRKQIAIQIKQIGEQAKISIRNIRRDGNKQLDRELKDKLQTEDDVEYGKKQMDEATKKFTSQVDELVKHKSEEIMQN